MNVSDIVAIIGLAVAIIFGIWGAFYKIFFKKKLEKWEKIRDAHQLDVKNTLRRKFNRSSIQYSNRFSANIMFQIGVDVYDTIQNSQDVRLTLDHLKKYRKIMRNWNKSSILVRKLRGKLSNLETYSSEKILAELGERYENDILYVIGSIVQKLLECNISTLDDIDFSISNQGIRLAIDFNKNGVFIPNKEEYNGDDIIGFLNNLIIDDGFIRGIEEIQNNNNDLKNEFDSFQSNLRDLLTKLDTGISLKGKCNKCTPFRVI